MHKDQIEKANSITALIGKEIIAYNKTELSSVSINNSKDLWKSVNKIRGGHRTEGKMSCIKMY